MPVRFGLGNDRRLRKSSDFDTVFKKGVRSADPFFKVMGTCEGSTRLGLAVSRKVSLKAVERNRIKRVVRESFRLSQTKLAGLDLIVVALKPSEAASNDKLRASLNSHWTKIISKCKPS